ncbi:DUF2171 domain-containing protein [Sphingomonas morindae]|uniref:DUF2171 domain-containing protein n=1 Tax=Sphingomonas morindae TaxID=1541170 RepID=A0ABY4X6T5_9SPHN|nr:DUF2171 domain-containing protein [Sphingomonas morindae]USI72606.1 DUF2171 domain-containing protein [Sphingomonas morindae]
MAYERNDRPDRGYRSDRDDYRRDDAQERGFFERAGDEVRSWFGDEEAERRRRYDERYDERYDRARGESDRYERGGRYANYEPGGYRSPDRYPNWTRSNRDESYGRAERGGMGYDRSMEGRQFDDGGSRTTGYGYGAGDYGYERERGREYRGGGERSGYGAQRYETGGRYGAGYDRDRGTQERGGLFGGREHDHHDHHDYRNWRDRQIDAFDRDYDEYRRENRSRFESEFSTWRQTRQTQRDSLQQVKEHQEVVGSDGAHVGTVDHVRSDHILLTKTDRDAGGHHHSIPSSWIATVADKVTLSKTAEEAKKAWREADERGGLFGGGQDAARDGANRGTTGTTGTGTASTTGAGTGAGGDETRGAGLDRSFSGTY